jgi:hypothetical protein
VSKTDLTRRPAWIQNTTSPRGNTQPELQRREGSVQAWQHTRTPARHTSLKQWPRGCAGDILPQLRARHAPQSFARSSEAREARLTDEKIDAAESFEGATMPNGQKYENWLKSKDRGEAGRTVALRSGREVPVTQKASEAESE